MKKYLSVGELARTFGLDVQTLHYYDTIGLFQPEIRDEKTRYRKYRFDQIYQLASIRYLRKMGYSLDNIQAYLDSRNPENSLVLLGKRSEELQRQWAQLMRINEAIERKIQFVNDQRSRLKTDSVEVQWFPERFYIPIGTEEILYLEDSFYFYPTIAFYEGDLKYFGAYLYEPSDSAGTHQPLADSYHASVIPAGPYLVGYHQGPYEILPRTIQTMRDTRRELTLGRRVVSFNIIDQFLERNRAGYLTQIQIPVEPAEVTPAAGTRERP